MISNAHARLGIIDSFQPGTNSGLGFYDPQEQLTQHPEKVPGSEDPEGGTETEVAPQQQNGLELKRTSARIGFLPIEQREAIIPPVGASGYSAEEAEICDCAPAQSKSGFAGAAYLMSHMEGEAVSDPMLADPATQIYYRAQALLHL